MIKITIVGGRNEVEKVRVVLKDRYGEMYSCRVIENIPEAVQNGAKFCTASFLVDDRYIDLDQFNKIKCKFSIVFNNKKMYERSHLLFNHNGNPLAFYDILSCYRESRIQSRMKDDKLQFANVLPGCTITYEDSSNILNCGNENTINNKKNSRISLCRLFSRIVDEGLSQGDVYQYYRDAMALTASTPHHDGRRLFTYVDKSGMVKGKTNHVENNSQMMQIIISGHLALRELVQYLSKENSPCSIYNFPTLIFRNREYLYRFQTLEEYVSYIYDVAPLVEEVKNDPVRSLHVINDCYYDNDSMWKLLGVSNLMHDNTFEKLTSMPLSFIRSAVSDSQALSKDELFEKKYNALSYKFNEAMYRLLEDEEVALIYAGADADYTRLLWFYLKKLLGEKMYHMYNKQDVRMLNILADSEYEGLHVIESEAKELAVQTEENLKILQETAYKYVGAYMDYQEKAGIIDAQYNMGIITKDEYESGYSQIIVDKEAKYEFEFKAADIRKVMYDILKYPIYSYTDTGVPKVDKYVRKKLLQETRKENSTARLLQHSILTYGSNYAEYEKLRAGSDEDKKKASKMELISVDEFNKLEYPLALLFEQYAILDKEYTSYYKPMLEDNLESKIFKSYSLARIETRRIMNPSQTMKKNLKKLVIPTSDDYYSVDFDLSQIELRLMKCLSSYNQIWMKNQ